MSLGTLLLHASLVISCFALFFSIRAATAKKTDLLKSRRLYYITSSILLFLLIILAEAFINSDFKYVYVYENSSRELGAFFRLSAVWAGKEGSFLLWAFFINISGLFVIKKIDRDEPYLLSYILIFQIFMLIMLVFESPFRLIWNEYPKELMPGQIPDNGAGLNPLLQDFWMVIHPPVLFLGYATAIIPSGYAIAGLIRKDYSSWRDSAYPWTVFSVTVLGLGIFLGGYWAYKVLGWGGYWGWDPVENSSLIPWLVSLALLHGMILQKRKKALVKTNIALSFLYTLLVFYSTYLTRSGVLSDFSVHSFSGYGLSSILITFMILILFSHFGFLLYRFGSVKSESFGNGFFKWDVILTCGIITLFIYAILILTGTSMPIISKIFLENPASVNSAFYNRISILPAVFIMLLMITSAYMIKKPSMPDFILMAVSLILAVIFNIPSDIKAVPILFSTLSLFIILEFFKAVINNRKKAFLPWRVAHLGAGVLVLGIIISGYHSTGQKYIAFQNRDVKIGDYLLGFDGFVQDDKSYLNFTLKTGKTSEKFKTYYYTDSRTNNPYREPHIIKNISGDIYIAPEKYRSGISDACLLRIREGQKKKLGNLEISFNKFNTKGMRSENPVIFADMTVNRKKLSPGVKFIKGKNEQITKKIPGTDRIISIEQINASAREIELFVTPGKNIKIKPDSVIVEVSFKKYIWLVWAGTILIALGGLMGFYRTKRIQK